MSIILCMTKEEERRTVDAVMLMARESLDPENFENLAVALKQLSKTRSMPKSKIKKNNLTT